MSRLCEDEISDIRVNLDNLHIEKSLLDESLQKLVTNRKTLEQNIEKARIKRHQAIECQNKTQDALNMAKFKIENVETQMKSLEDKSIDLREKVGKLQTELESELKREEKDLCDFEDQLQQLSYLFLNAVTFYTNESLEAEKVKAQKDGEQVEWQLSEAIGQLETLNCELESLMSQPSNEPWDLDLPLENRRIVLKMFQDEHRSLQQMLERVAIDRNRLQEEIDKLK